MTKKIDCRRLQCPAPVLKTKEYLEQNAATKIDVIVDNDAAVENISRYLDYNGFSVSVDTDGVDSIVSGRRDKTAVKVTQTAPKPARAETAPDHQKILVVLSSQQIGKKDDELGQKLMVNFVKTLKEMGPDLWRLILLNHGVKFSTKGSRVLDELKELDASGVSVLVCGTCLTHLGIFDDKLVGDTTNMLDVVTSMQLADKVINL